MTPVNVSLTEISNFLITCWFFSHTVFHNVCHILSLVAVDCGFPNIPEDGILYLVGSDDPRTQYKDRIQFNCSSSYYILDGDGDYTNIVYIPLFSFSTLNYAKFLYAFFNLLDTYTCNANGDWESNGGKTEMPKCIEGMTLNVCLTYSQNNHHSFEDVSFFT